jgi:hypothetical protein
VSVDPFQPPGAISSGSVLAPPVDVSRPLSMADPYAESVDLKQVFSSEEREALKRHRLTPGVPPWAFVALTILTFGLFGTMYHQLKQSKLPVVKHNDPTAAKAIGFLLIPVFNLYWSFVAWPRLVDRINFQYRLRGHPAPINRAHVVPALALALFGWIVPIAAVAGCVWLLVLGAILQSAANRLATGRV